MTDTVSASYLPVPHPIPSRKYPHPNSFHWLRSSSCFSNRIALLLTSRRNASPRRRILLALPRGRTNNGFFWENDFDEELHDANSNTPRHPAHTGGGSRNGSSGRSGGGPKLDSRRFVGNRRRTSQTTTRFEYERFKDMFAEENVEMGDQSANAVGTPSLDAGRSRIALLSESQPSRLHNRFVVFERATESKLVRLSSKGDNSSSSEATPVESASVPRSHSRLHRQKLSYNGQGKSSAKNLGKLYLNPGQETTSDATSKSTSSNFSSKLQIILNNFNKRDGSPATEPSDNAAGSSGLQIGKNLRTEKLEAQREDFWNTSPQATQGTRKGSQASEEAYPTFSELSIEEANEDERKTTGASAQMDYEPFNLFSNAPPIPSESSELSSVSKFYIPIGKRRMGASSQQAHVSPRRLSRSIGSRSSPSRSSIPGRFSKYSKQPDSNDEQGSSPYTSTSDFRSYPREGRRQFLLKSKEGFKSHAFQELDEDTEKHHSSYDSSSAASFRESCIDVPAQPQTNFFPDVWYDSNVEIDVQPGSFAPTVVEGANLVSPLPEQLTSLSDVEDDVVSRSFISAAVVGTNAMSSLPERSLLLSEESGPSTALSDPNLDAHVSLGDDEVSGLTMSRAVTKQSAISSWPVLSTQSNLISSAIPDLDVESDNLQEGSSASNLKASQISTKPDDIKNQPSSDLPFGFQYSYTETPNAPILRYREPQHSPFGPMTMGRPWTGRAPPKPSKKKVRMFDSFKPPPQGKKGIKYVQDPGPFPEGQLPKAARTREEILGEPLTKEEAMQLVEKCKNEKRQVNLGRDGLTHNMLDLIHSQWKRRRVCKIKCKGVPTVDMDNVYFHIEDKTGGKIIYRVGGVVFLFRGRNYNYKDRPKIPLMLWKPSAPVYPKLIQQTPGGLAKEQARQLRLLGRKQASICRLGKNGVYLNLVKDVRNAFKVDDLVRIDCRGLNPSDYKKIGAKLKDLVPCVLISFDREHILLWKGRGQDPYSTEINSEDANTSSVDNLELEVANESSSFDLGPADSSISEIEMNVLCGEPSVSSHAADNAVLSCFGNRETSPQSCLNDTQFALVSSSSAAEDKSPLLNVNDLKSPSQVKDGFSENSQEEVKDFLDKDISSPINYLEKQCLDKVDMASNEAVVSEYSSRTWEDSRELDAAPAVDKEDLGNSFMAVKVKEECSQVNNHSIGVTVLWERALESGMAIEIDEADLDTDSVGYKADEFAKTAPPGPTYTQNLLKKLRLKNVKRISDGESNSDIGRMRIRPRQKKKDMKRAAEFPFLEVPPMGGLPVDELARLLAPN